MSPFEHFSRRLGMPVATAHENCTYALRKLATTSCLVLHCMHPFLHDGVQLHRHVEIASLVLLQMSELM